MYTSQEMSNLRRFLARFLRDGDADEAVEAFINETLEYNPDVKCSHHEHNHGEGHTCGEHGCGSHSCP